VETHLQQALYEATKTPTFLDNRPLTITRLGKSWISATVPNLDQRMDDARAVMDAAGIERAAIMGVSEGGSLAVLFAASHPERCSTLILYGAFARFLDWFPAKQKVR
jgi:pimeloyl-ACP methyl ester carboxylesterase